MEEAMSPPGLGSEGQALKKGSEQVPKLNC